MRIAITGAQGQLGGELCRQLGAAAIPLDLPEFDLTRPATVRRALRRVRPDAVINAAAYTLVDKAEQEPALCKAINADGVAPLADYCAESGAALVQISTDYVFGHVVKKIPLRETDEPSARGVYATTKRLGELAAMACPRHFVVRTCGLYGEPGVRSAGNFVATMLRLAEQGRRLRVVADQHCQPTYVPHLARAIGFLLTTAEHGVYHVTNSGQTTWHGFAEAILRAAGIAAAIEPITTAQYGAAAPRPAYSVLDTSRYHALPGRPAMPAWESALAEHLDRIRRPAILPRVA